MRFHFLDADPERQTSALARTATGTLFIVTTVAAIAVAVAAAPVSNALLGFERTRTRSAPPRSGCGRSRTSRSPTRCCASRSAARAFATASLINVGLTVALTVFLVVVRDEGALGLLLGNYVASAVVLIGLWSPSARRSGSGRGGIERAQLGPMLRFGAADGPRRRRRSSR